MCAELEKWSLEECQAGTLEGQEAEKKQTILGMLREKLPLDMIARVTHASIDQITEIGKLNGLL